MMTGQSELANLERLAAGMVLDSTSTTDELTDKEAQPLIEWGLAQAKAAAGDVAREPALRAASSAQRQEALAERVAVVRRVMKVLNNLAVDRHSLSTEQVAGEMQYLWELAARLPRPPAPRTTSIAGADASQRPGAQAGLANGPFVRDVLNLLEPGPWPPDTASPRA